MGKLNQVIAIEKGIKARVVGQITELYKVVQKPALFNGFTKSYAKRDDDSEDLPGERQRVQFNVRDMLQGASRALTELMDVTARKDWTNCEAKGSVEVNDQVLIPNAPVSFLLFLEKQLTDMRTFIGALPVLDEAETWARDENAGLYRSDAISTHRTKKVQRPIVLYNATTEHPAQTQLITEDVIAGFWNTVKHSGAMPKPERQAMLERVETLLKAVKTAREAANMNDEIDVPEIGEAVFGYLLGR
jgi:hypothetical protein